MELGLPPIGRNFDIIGMINDLEDDNELKHIFKRHLSSSETIHRSVLNNNQRNKNYHKKEQ
jgi:hypothetical protein